MNALKAALDANNSSYGESIPPSLLQDVFADWTRGVASDDELVSALLPIKGQPPLLRLQILAQAVAFGQLLSARAEACLAQEEEATLDHLDALEELAEGEGVTPALEAAQEAFAFHLRALHTLGDAADGGEPTAYLQSLELGEKAATSLHRATNLEKLEAQESGDS